MTPISYFEDAWQRCDEIKSLQIYLDEMLTSALSADELLRSEWVARVSALDLYVHELVAQKMSEIFEGRRPTCPGYGRFSCSTETVLRIKNAVNATEATAAFDLDVKGKLGRITYQYPEDIADGVRMISDCQLWNELAIRRGATASTKTTVAKAMKRDLSLVVDRRNKIAHEGDLQPTIPRTPWPISRSDVDFAATLIEDTVRGIETVI